MQQGQEGNMKYLNGKLRAEQDTTLCFRPGSQKQKLSWLEYLPLIVLGVLMSALLLKYLLG